MKLRYIMAVMIILSLVVLAGCNKEEPAAEEPDTVIVESETVDSTETETVEETPVEEEMTEEETVEEPTEEMTEEETTEETTEETEEATEEETVEEAGSETHVVTIENFISKPQEDWNIKVGDSMEWKNEMPNFVHRIAIFEPEDDGTYSQRWINEIEDTLEGESYTYQFNETGKYKWGSLTKFNKVVGYITVTE